jgi:LysM repeat protein
MATVHTEYGPGRIIDRETVRGRTRCKVAGEGFEVWVDQAKLGGLDDYDEYNDSADDRDGDGEDVHDLRRKLRVEDDGYGDDDPARYSRRLAWAPLDRDNSTELPYDPDPQHEAIGTPGDDGSSTIQPIHHIDADERLRPADSISFDPGADDGSPGPDADLFAREGSLGKRAFLPAIVFNQHEKRIKNVLHKALGPGKGQIAFMGLKGRVYGGSYGDAVQSVDSAVSRAADWASPGGTTGGYGDMIHNAAIEREAYAQLIPMLAPLLRGMAPAAIGNLLDGGGGEEGGEGYGPGEGYGDMIQASHRRAEKSLSELFPPSTWDEHDRSENMYAPDGSTWDEYDERHPREHEGSYRPAGLSDRYVDLTASVDHDDPVAQFRHDPDAYINRVGHLMDEGLNPRFAEYMELVEGDSSVRTAAWKDVRKKALRLKREGHVTVKDMSPSSIMASVVGDHGTYDVVVLKGASINGVTGNSIANWHCACEWGRWAFRRKYTYVGRLCSHAYASYLTMQSAALKGKERPRRPGPTDAVIVNRPARDRALPTFTYAAGRRTADTLQNGPERITPEMVVNDTDDTHIFLDVTEDERDDTGPDDVVSDKDIVHFARLMRHCEVTEQPYPRRLVAFLSRYSGCVDDSADDTPADHEAHDADDADRYLEQIRADGDRGQEGDFGSMADRVHRIQDAVEEARAHGVDADRFVAAVRRIAAPGDSPLEDDLEGIVNTVGDVGNKAINAPRSWYERARSYVTGDPAKDPSNNNLIPRFDIGDDDDNAANAAAEDANKYDDDGPIGGPRPGPSPGTPKGQQNNNGQANNGQANNGQQQTQTVNQAQPSAGAAGTGWKAPAGGTKGPVADGGVAGAENGNNSAIIGDTYTVQEGDTATDIAQRAYGDMNRYQEIADANNITDVDFGFKPGQEIKLNDAKGNSGMAGNVTNPAGGGSDKNMATPDAGPAAAAVPAAPAPAPAQPAQTDASQPATIVKQQSRRTARDWLRWAAEGDGTAGEASPSANDQAAGAQPATATTPPTSPGAAPATNPATEQTTVSKEDDTLDPDDPTQIAEQQQAMPGQQPADTTPPTTGFGLGGATGGGMDMSGVGDMVNTGIGVASDIASGIGGALGGGGLASGIGGLASGIGSAISGIFSSRQDAEDWRRYAYPAGGGDDFDPETLPHIPFAGSGNPGPVEYGTSEEYADEARAKMDDVTDLGDDPLSTPMGEWQKQGAYDDTDDSSDVVRAFQANLGDTALGAGGGGGGRFDDIAGAAAGFLRTAGRNYSLSEQSELIREGDKGGAGNLGDLDLRGTHYEDMTTLGW